MLCPVTLVPLPGGGVTKGLLEGAARWFPSIPSRLGRGLGKSFFPQLKPNHWLENPKCLNWNSVPLCMLSSTTLLHTEHIYTSLINQFQVKLPL